MSVLTSGFLICTRIYSKNHLNVFTIPSSGYLRFSYDKKHPTIKYLLIFKSKKINPIMSTLRSTKSRFKREHALKVEKLSNQILWLDREMGSDLNATSFYKTEF